MHLDLVQYQELWRGPVSLGPVRSPLSAEIYRAGSVGGCHSKDAHIPSRHPGRRVPGGRNRVLFAAVSAVVSPIAGMY